MENTLDNKYTDIKNECEKSLLEYNERTMNPILDKWREDYKFFKKNFNKIKNMQDYVDLDNNSFERKRRDEWSEKEKTKQKLKIIAEEKFKKDDIPNF